MELNTIIYISISLFSTLALTVLVLSYFISRSRNSKVQDEANESFQNKSNNQLENHLGTKKYYSRNPDNTEVKGKINSLETESSGKSDKNARMTRVNVSSENGSSFIKPNYTGSNRTNYKSRN